MPYASLSELPSGVKGALPKHGQQIYRAAFNAAHKEYSGDESKSHATAWAAVKTKYAKKGEKWVKVGDASDDEPRDEHGRWTSDGATDLAEHAADLHGWANEAHDALSAHLSKMEDTASDLGSAAENVDDTASEIVGSDFSPKEHKEWSGNVTGARDEAIKHAEAYRQQLQDLIEMAKTHLGHIDEHMATMKTKKLMDGVTDMADGTRLHFSDKALLDPDPDSNLTRDGYLKAFARIARSGVQDYKGSELRRPDLAKVKVYRPPEEVFAHDAMRSMAHRPLTLYHPRQDVTAKNWREHTVGYTGDEVVRDGDHVRVPLMLCDQAAIDAVHKDGVKQLSVGYSADIEWAEGKTPEGEHYDAIQHDIQGNHLAIVGEARGGQKLTIDGGQDFGDDTTPTTTCWSCAQRIPATADVCPFCRTDQAAESDEIKTTGDLENAIKSMVRGKNFSAEKVRIYKAAKKLGKVQDLPEDWNIGDAAKFKDGMNYFDKEFSTEKRKALAKTGAAMKGGGYPIESKQDLHNAIQAFGRAKNPAATKAHIIQRARALGATGDLPEDWNVKDQGVSRKKPKMGYGEETDDEQEASGGQEMSDMQMIDGVPVRFADEGGAAYVMRTLANLRRQLADAKAVKDQDEEAEEVEEKRKKQAQEDMAHKDGQIAALKKQLADAQNVDDRVEKRIATCDAAVSLLPQGYVFRGKSEVQIMRDAVKTSGMNVDTMDDARVEGAFMVLTSGTAGTGVSRMADGMSYGVQMSDRAIANQRSNGWPRNGVFQRNDGEAMRDQAFADRERYYNTAWQGQRGLSPNGNNTNDFGRR